MAAKKSAVKEAVLPSVPTMMKCMVARWEYENQQVPMDELVASLGYKATDGVRRIATKAARLCAKGCWFCGGDTKTAVKKDAVDWLGFELCGCMAKYRREVVWHMPLPTIEELDALRRKVASGELPARTPVVTRTCGSLRPGPDGRAVACSNRFTLSAGQYKACIDSADRLIQGRDRADGRQRGELERLVDFKHPVKCLECRNAAKQRLGTDNGSVIKDRSAPNTQRHVKPQLKAV